MWNQIWEWAINHYIYNAAVVLAVVVFIVNFLKHVLKSKLIHGFLSKYKKIKVGASGIELERNEEKDSEKDIQQDSILSAIKDELKNINTRLDSHYKYIKEAAIQAGVSVVWSGTKAPFVETIKAAFLNIKLEQNGNLIDRLVQLIMEGGKNGVYLYKSLLNDFMNKDENKNLSPYFKETMKTIEKKIRSLEVQDGVSNKLL